MENLTRHRVICNQKTRTRHSSPDILVPACEARWSPEYAPFRKPSQAFNQRQSLELRLEHNPSFIVSALQSGDQSDPLERINTLNQTAVDHPLPSASKLQAEAQFWT